MVKSALSLETRLPRTGVSIILLMKLELQSAAQILSKLSLEKTKWNLNPNLLTKKKMVKS